MNSCACRLKQAGLGVDLRVCRHFEHSVGCERVPVSDPTMPLVKTESAEQPASAPGAGRPQSAGASDAGGAGRLRLRRKTSEESAFAAAFGGPLPANGHTGAPNTLPSSADAP